MYMFFYKNSFKYLEIQISLNIIERVSVIKYSYYDIIYLKSQSRVQDFSGKIQFFRGIKGAEIFSSGADSCPA